MPDRDRRRLTLFISMLSFTLIGLVLLALWNLFLVDEIKKSEIEREGLKKSIEKVEVLEKTNRNLIKDVLRQKAIALCFFELIGEHEEKYSQKNKEDCIQLIGMADEKYGHKGLDAPLILSWLEKESRGDPEAVSHSGAKGLTQWMDYRAWKILAALGYPGYDKKLVFDPVINLEGGIYHLNSLMNFWKWKGVENQDNVIFYTLYSDRWGAEGTEALYNTNTKASGKEFQYINWILNRREYWAKKLRYWIDDGKELAERWQNGKEP